MKSSVVITLVGPDRPGLVESISRNVESGDGNWTHSRMAHLGGQFAGMLMIETDESHVDELIESLKKLESEGLTVTAVRGQADTADAAASNDRGEVISMELVGQDRPGIVRHISAALAAHGANIEELTTECFSAAMSGETMFRATARLNLPSQVDVTMIQQELEAIALDLMVDLTIGE